MKPDYIVLRGARENNLKDIHLRIPKRKITVFTGVSGSGKSSVVFDTISAEAQRQLNETFSTFIRNRLPKTGQPEVDSIENLSTAIVIDQKRLGGNSRSTVGTATDINALLRLLFSRVGTPFIGYSNAFSFNDPAGMCPGCQGMGTRAVPDIRKLFDRSKSLNEGAVRFSTFTAGTWYAKHHLLSGLFDPDKKLRDYTDVEWQRLLYGKSENLQLPSDGGMPSKRFEGVVDRFIRLYFKKDGASLPDNVKRYITFSPCELCGGTRLNKGALDCKINGQNIAEVAAKEIEDLLPFLKSLLGDKTAAPILSGMIPPLQHLLDVGLGYLRLDRETKTLSGGESQRIKMVRHLNSSLTDMLYIFDEPSTGLHPRDVERLNGLLRKLRDKGNTILVVEHDRDVIRIGDHIVDMGPGAGAEGGRVVYEGNLEGLYKADTLTGKNMKREIPFNPHPRKPSGWLTVENASLHNLKNITVRIPSGVLTVVTGMAGSGKSTLIHDVFAAENPEAVVIDQSPVSGNIRSTPATYTGIMDEIRHLFARTNGVSDSLFSFNSKGACPDCGGLGFLETDMAFLEPVKTVCERCGGKRFKEDVLGYMYKGKSIYEVLKMTAHEALYFFEEEKIVRPLQAIRDVGLGYLALGQPLSTLSGGECQRIKLASKLHRQGRIYILDEPTTGLHMADVSKLLAMMNRLVGKGNTVIVIEHNGDVIKQADWIIELGPEAGKNGGEVIFEGTPLELAEADGSVTGPFLYGMQRRNTDGN